MKEDTKIVGSILTRRIGEREDEGYLIPELEIRVTKSWVRLIRFVQANCQHGDIKFRIVNAQPAELIECKPKVRFDKEEVIPATDGISFTS